MEEPQVFKLRAWRHYRGLTHYALASKAGISRASLHYLERTDQLPLSGTVRKLATALECQPSDLYFNPPTDDRHRTPPLKGAASSL